MVTTLPRDLAAPRPGLAASASGVLGACGDGPQSGQTTQSVGTRGITEGDMQAPGAVHSSLVPAKVRLLLILGLLGCHVALVLHCSLEDFATFDEAGHLCAGISSWQSGSYRLYNVNPPLPRLLAAVPVLLADPETGAVRLPTTPSERPEWNIGDRFARDNAPRFHALLVAGRCVTLAWSVAGALGVYFWARTLWGASAGLVALTIWCFEPSIIALAHIINSDLPAAVAALWAAYAFRGYLAAPSWRTALLAGCLLGLAQSCKFTLLVLTPLWCLFWLGLLRGRQALPAALGQLALLLGVSVFVINLCYQFAETGTRLEDIPFVSETLAGPSTSWRGQGHGNRFAGSLLGAMIVPLPVDYLRGIDVQRRDFEPGRSRLSYLGGQWQAEGWWYYYLYSVAVKVPLGLLLLLLLSLAWTLLPNSPARVPLRELLLLWAPALVVLALVSSQRGQQHFRYLLPALPFVIVYVGGVAAAYAARRRWARFVVGALLLWSTTSYLRVHPHALAYFNELAGGPEHGHEHLVGSSLDWGQDLHRLKRWLDDNPQQEKLQLAYLNHIDARIAGLEFELPPLGVGTRTPPAPKAALRLGPHPGLFAVSAGFVRGQPQSAPDGRGGYRFNPHLSLSYFQEFRPIARAGYSIFIYRITLAEANEFRARHGLRLLPAGR
jgi:hypothetical protein